MESYVPLILGGLFIGLGIYVVISYIRKLRYFRINGHAVIGTITDISGMRKNRRAFVSYRLGSLEHTGELNYYSSFMKTGSKVNLYVSATDPLHFIYRGVGPIVLGVFTVLVGIVLIIL